MSQGAVLGTKSDRNGVFHSRGLIKDPPRTPPRGSGRGFFDGLGIISPFRVSHSRKYPVSQLPGHIRQKRERLKSDNDALAVRDTPTTQAMRSRSHDSVCSLSCGKSNIKIQETLKV